MAWLRFFLYAAVIVTVVSQRHRWGGRIRQRWGWWIAEDGKVTGFGQQDWEWWFLGTENRHGGRMAPQASTTAPPMCP